MKVLNQINRKFISKLNSKQYIIVLLMFCGLCYGQNSLKEKDSVLIDSVSQNNPFKTESGNCSLDYFKWKSDYNFRNDSIKIFSLSPISRRVNKVNGFAIGGGHYENQKIKLQTVNGLNTEASPISLALISFSINVPFESLFVGINDNVMSNVAFFDDEIKTYIKVNGLNISSGGFMGGAELRGVNFSVFSAMNKMNGFSMGGILNTKSFAGVSISGLANLSDSGNGIQIAISNVSRRHNGIQIGLFNNSKELRGMQFGVWNTNGKRKLPFFNWQFRK